MELALLGNLVTAIIACTGVGIRTLRNRTVDFVDWFVGAFGILNGLGIGLTYWTEITGRRTSFLSGLTYLSHQPTTILYSLGLFCFPCGLRHLGTSTACDVYSAGKTYPP